jgi:hypothetical protein
MLICGFYVLRLELLAKRSGIYDVSGLVASLSSSKFISGK